MKTQLDLRTLLVVTALLLAANLVVGLRPATVFPTARADTPSDGLLPRPRSQYQAATVLTSSPDGSLLYVWDTEVVNGAVIASGRVFGAGQ